MATLKDIVPKVDEIILKENELMLVSEFVGMMQEELRGRNFYSVHPFLITDGLYAMTYGIDFMFNDELADEFWKTYRQADPGIEELVFNPDTLPRRLEHLLSRIRENFIGSSFQDLEMVVVGRYLTIRRIGG